MDKKFYVGLDIGTDSVGWAVTDEHYQLARMRGKTAWGARIFDEAEDAKTRRTHRSTSRRMQRRKYRIELLNSLFNDELDKIDNNFLIRLQESNYCEEDKIRSKSKYPIFSSKEMEKDFYKRYPTIWHLRKKQMIGDEKSLKDLRLVYLSLHHIIKYRGNFLSDGEYTIGKFDYSIFDSLNQFFRSVIAEKEENCEDDIEYEFITKDNQKDFIDVLENSSYNKTDKKSNLKNVINVYEAIKTEIEFFLSLVVGGSFDSAKLGEEYEKKKIQIDRKYDENEGDYRSILGDRFTLVENAKFIVDFISLNSILKGHKSISDAFASIYDSHKEQLRVLKQIAYDVDKANHLENEESVFFRLFKDKKAKANYAAFVHKNTDESRPSNIHEFNSFVLNVLAPYKEQLNDNKENKQIKFLAEKDELLQTISYVSSSVVPHQLHEHELKLIIDNASVYHPFLKNIKEKIILLFKFRVPYFYGPLDDRSSHSNVDRITNDTITPWNIDQVIDRNKTRSNFMNSLTNKCSYLYGENVLPRNSILFEDYVVLNKLNGLQINGAKIPQEIKIDLFNNFITHRKKTTKRQIETYLAAKFHEIYGKDGVSISGFNTSDCFEENSRSCLSHVFDLSKDMEKVERIIYLLTIYTDNHKDALEVINKEFELTDQQQAAVNNMHCKGWATLSKKLLVGLKYVDDVGVVTSIMDLLKDTTYVFMQILHDEKYQFLKLIDEKNKEFFGTKTVNESVEDIIQNAPPKMRRSTIQALRIVDELAKVAKKQPDVIAVEVTRTNKAKKKQDGVTISRKKELDKFLKGLINDKTDKEVSAKAKSVSDELKTLELMRLKGKHIYLYFKQCGFDVYTGKPININDVLDSTKYDTDHIIPRSMMKDDSLDNLVLVDRDYNQKVKSDHYPIPRQIRNDESIQHLWKLLHKRGAMSDKKYNNLIRSGQLTDEEIQQFVSSQINSINQSNILVRDVLKLKYPNTKLIFSKAEYPSYIRKAYNIPKIRDLNDCHHAVDAYLNVITGTILNNVYGDMRVIKAREASKTGFSMNMERTLDRHFADGELKNLVLHNCCERHDFLLTYRLQYQDSDFYDQTIYAKGAKTSLIPVHSDTKNPLSDTIKYGGYSGLTTEYHVVATINNGKKTIRKLVPVSHLLVSSSRDSEDIYESTINNLETTEQSKADINRKIRLYNNQKLFINGCVYLFCSRNENQINLKPATPIFLIPQSMTYLKSLEKCALSLIDFEEAERTFFTDKNKTNSVSISKARNLDLYKEIVSKSFARIYDICPMICNLRGYLEEDKINQFMAKTLHEQYLTIRDSFALFTRKSSTLITSKITSSFLVSKAAVLKNEVYIVRDSITGLFSRREIV